MNFSQDFLPILVNTIIIIPFSALFLWLVSKILKLDDQRYGTAFKISLAIFGLSFLINLIKVFFKDITYIYLLMSVINWFGLFIYLALVLIKKRYQLDWADTFTTWLIWLTLWFIIGLMLSYVFSGLILSIFAS
ncbi:MAG: hypothetical protein M1338_05750 [Patescibacteria group bacterium]|nr:hypothetical protein [Patescibacteria group bacterium]